MNRESCTQPYYKINKDPTKSNEDKLVRSLKSLEKKGDIPSKLYKRIRPSGCRPPLFYGLPKVHKPGVPLRPIVSSVNSPSYNLSKHIAKLLSPMSNMSDSYIKDSGHFMSIIKEVSIEEDDLMVSFDVCSLFTNVPIDEAIVVIREILILLKIELP